MNDKPIHVQVAEALGRKRPSEEGRCDACGWPVVEEGGQGCWPSNCSMRPIPKGDSRADAPARYDLDWSATGPLVEKYGINVVNFLSHQDIRYWWADWRGEEKACPTCDHRTHEEIRSAEIFGVEPKYESTPLLAICNLIIALGKAGKL